MTLNAISLGPAQQGFPQITALISATTYLVPAAQGVMNGATPAGPGAGPAARIRLQPRLAGIAVGGGRNLSTAMNHVRTILTDLREKRLWPVALALLMALVAVPLLLSTSSQGAPVAPLLPAAAAVPPAAATTAVSVQQEPTHSRLSGRGRDPFAQQAVSAGGTGRSGSSRTARTVPAATGSSGSAGSTGTTAGTGAGAATGATTSPTTAPPTTSPPPSVTPQPAPTGLTATQSYRVTIGLTNSAGGLNTIDPVERLSILPSARQPLLVELGVLKGGSRVLFVVPPGTVVKGPGTCTPGPIDCEILALAEGQTEGISAPSRAGVVPVALFAVTAITADEHASTGAADKARRVASAAGRRLLSTSTLGALSLFKYQPSLGAVLDLRNLTVGGG